MIPFTIIAELLQLADIGTTEYGLRKFPNEMKEMNPLMKNKDTRKRIYFFKILLPIGVELFSRINDLGRALGLGLQIGVIIGTSGVVINNIYQVLTGTKFERKKTLNTQKVRP